MTPLFSCLPPDMHKTLPNGHKRKDYNYGQSNEHLVQKQSKR